MDETEDQPPLPRAAVERPPASHNNAIVVRSDITSEERKREVVEVCQIACEKYSAAEKGRSERDNQAAAAMIKDILDSKMNGPFNVVVGESFTLDIDHIEDTLLYMYFGGHLCICVWKCV